MNAEAYYAQQEILVRQKVIAIGKTTAGKLTELGIQDFLIAPYPTEEGLVEAVLYIQNESGI
jgi:uroporphyrinogen-III synthase